MRREWDALVIDILEGMMKGSKVEDLDAEHYRLDEEKRQQV